MFRLAPHKGSAIPGRVRRAAFSFHREIPSGSPGREVGCCSRPGWQINRNCFRCGKGAWAGSAARIGLAGRSRAAGSGCDTRQARRRRNVSVPASRGARRRGTPALGSTPTSAGERDSSSRPNIAVDPNCPSVQQSSARRTRSGSNPPMPSSTVYAPAATR